MSTITRENLTIIFGDKNLSCDPAIPKTVGGMTALLAQRSIKSIEIITDTLATETLIFPHQTHGTDALVIRSVADAERFMARFYDADIVITTVPGIAVGVLTADCLPLILFDQQHGILAAVHAGWRGTVKNTAQAAVQKMVRCGAHADQIIAYFGPCARGETYEASLDLMAALESSVYLKKVIKTRVGKNYFNMPRMNELQLLDAGLLPEHIVLDYCLDTLTNSSYWSYRRDGEQALRQPSVAVFG
jgi:polyphenol oxidase